MWSELPLPVRAFHLWVCLTAVTATSVSMALSGARPVPHMHGGRWPELGLVALLAGSCAASAWYGDVLGTRSGQKSVLVTICPAFHLTAALLLPLPGALLVVTATLTALQLRRRPLLYKQLFNAAVYALSITAAAGTFRWVAGDATAVTALMGAAFAAALVYALLDVGAFVVYVKLAFRLGPVESELVAIVEKLSQLTFGILCATLWATSPALVLLLLPIGITLQRAVVFRTVERASQTDPKTGLLNDRAFRDLATQELTRAARTAQSLALLMLDLDHLREVNNTHGHLVGDLVIRRIADVLRATLRDLDVAGRFGGEEFAVVLPSTTATEAGRVAERIRTAFAAEPIAAPSGPLSVSVSIGVAAAEADSDNLDDVMRRADKVLYEAKRAGRNQVRVHGIAAGPSIPEPRDAAESASTALN